MDVRRRRAEAPLVEVLAVLIEDLHTVVLAVVDEDPPGLSIDCDAVHVVEVAGALFGRRTLLAPCHQELAVLVELHDAGVRVPVGHEECAVGQPRDERRTVEVFVVGGMHVGLTDGLQQPFSVVAENENRVPVVIDDPDALLRIVWADVDGVGPPQHLVPLSPVFDDIAVRIHDNDAMLPSEVHSGLTDIRIVAHFSIGCFEPARRAGRCRIAKGQPADGEFDVRAELRELDLLRPLDVGQFPALQDEDTVRALGEHALPGAPRPLLVARQTRDRLRPVRHDVVRAEHVLATLLARHGREPGFGPRLSLNGRQATDDQNHHHRDDDDRHNQRGAFAHAVFLSASTMKRRPARVD